MLLDTYAFYFVCMVAFSYSPAVCSVVGIIYSLLLAWVVYFATMATKSDPTDPTIFEYKQATQNK